MNGDIIKKYREYLTKAQIRELAKRAELYKQTHTEQRASALSELRTQYDTARRGLQNAGLASRQGNLISGKEKAMRAPLMRQYQDYNRQLKGVEDAYTERAAAQMANETIAARNAAARRAREREIARLSAEQAANGLLANIQNAEQNQAQRMKEYYDPRNKVVWNQRVTDTGIGTPSKPSAKEVAAAVKEMGGVSAVRNQMLLQHTQDRLAKEYHDATSPLSPQNRLTPEEKLGVLQKANDPQYRFIGQFGANTNEIKASDPQGAAQIESVVEKNYNTIDAKQDQWMKDIEEGQKAASLEISPRDSVGKMNRSEAIRKMEIARNEMASAYSELSRMALAVSAPDEDRYLYMMSDDEFAVAKDAAIKQSENILKEVKKDKWKKSDAQKGEAWVKQQTAYANELVAKFERVELARKLSSEEWERYSLVQTDKQYDNKYRYASYAVEEGEDANDVRTYDKYHNTQDSDYAFIVNKASRGLDYKQKAYRYTARGKIDNLSFKLSDPEADFTSAATSIELYKDGVVSGETTAQGKFNKAESVIVAASYMTDDEISRFNTILGTYGAKEADNYFEYLYNTILPARVNQAINEDYDAMLRRETVYDESGNRIGAKNGKDTLALGVTSSLLSVPLNVAEGIVNPIETMKTGQQDTVAARLNARMKNSAQETRNAVQENFGESGRFWYGTGMSAADSMFVAWLSGGIGNAVQAIGVPAKIASKVGSTLGGAMLGGSAYNSAYSEALERGLSPEKARMLAAGNGVNEMLFEAVSLDLLVSRFKTGDILKVSKNGFVNWAVNTLVEAGVEGSEEGFTDIANKLWDDKIGGIYSEELTKLREYMSNGDSYEEAKRKVNDEFAEQIWLSVAGGAVSGGVLGGAAGARGSLNARSVERYGKNVSKSETAVNELRNFDFADKEMSDLAKSKKLTYQDIAMLDLERTRQSIADSTAYIDKAVADGKMPQEVADIYKKAAENGFQYEENGEIVNPEGVTVDEALVMQKYSDVITNADLIRDGMKSVVDSLDAAQRTFDTELDNIYNDTQITEAERGERITAALAQHTQAVSQANEAVKNTVEMRDKETQERINALPKKQRSAAQAEYDAAKARENESPLDIDSEARTVRTENGSVKFDFDGNNTVETMTQEQRDSLNFAKLFADKYGLNIEIAQQFVGDQANKNGDYNPKTNTIRINLSGTNSVVYTVSHELTHWLKDHNEQAFTDLSNMIKEQLGRIDLVSSDLPEMYQDKMSKYMTGDRSVWDALIAYERDRYEKNGIKLDLESVEEEVVARCCESFLARESFMREMAKKHLKSARSIAQFLQKMRNDIASLQEAARSRNAEQNIVSDTSPEDTLMQQYTEIEQIAGLWTRGVNEAVRERKAAKQASVEVKASISDTFSSDIAQWDKSGRQYDATFHLGSTGAVLQGLGAIENDIYMLSDKVNDILEKHGNQGITIEIIKQIPKIVDNPYLVLSSRNVENAKQNTRLVMFGSVKTKDGKAVLAILDLRPSENGIVVDDMQKLTSAYVKDTNIETFLNNSDALYVDKKKTPAVLRSLGFYMPSELQRSGYIGNIAYKGRSVNISGIKFSKLFEKQSNTKSSIMDKEFRMTKQGAVRTFEQRDTTATVVGSNVELEGGSLLNRVRMMQNLAEEYGSVTVDAKSEKEAEAFKRAGAKQETDAFSGSEYGTWAFEHQENKYETDTQYDAKQKRQFANDVLKEIGTRKNFTRDELVRYRAALEKAFAVLHNSTYGKGDQLAAYEYADKLFDRMLDSYAEMSEADADMRDTLLSNMPRATDSRGRMYRVLEMTAKQMSEIKNAYESAAAYSRELSKALGSRVFVKETANAKTLEDIFTHSTDTRFNAETNEGDMPGELLKIAEQTKEQRTNPYKAESAEREAMKAQLWDKAVDIVGVEKSTAQKVREAVKEARAEERAKAKTKVQTEVEKARLAERMHEGALRAQERRASATREAAIKQRAADREAKLKETTKQRLEQQRLEQLRRDTKTVALKWNQRLVKMLANPTEASHIPVQLAREVAEFTKTLTEYLDSGTQRGQINLEKVMKAYQRAFDDQATIAEAQKENPNYDPRGQVIDREMYDEQLVSMMNELNEVIKGKSFKDLSAFEMRMLLNTVRGVAHTVYDANRMIGQSERKAIWKVGSTMVSELENAPAVPKGLRGYLETSLDLRRLALAFSGSNKNAEFVKLVEQLNDGAIEKERVAQVLQDMFKSVTDTYGNEIRKWYGKNAEWIDTGITKNGHKIEITKGMRVSLAMHVLNEGNMRHIENGGLTIPNREMYRKGNLTDAYANGELVRLNAEQINEIISHMTDAEKAYVNTAKEFFHKRTGYYVNRTSLQLLGYRKATVENYFPIHTDKNFTKTDFASLVMNGSIEGQGFLQERVMASNPIYLEDITSVVNRQIRGVALYAGLAVPMRNFNAVMNAAVYEDDNGVWSPRTTVKQTMTQKMGEYGAKIVKGFLEDVSEMSHVDVTPMERFAGKLATNYVKAVLLGNLKVAMKQVASYPTAAAVIPWKYLGKALLAGGKNHRLISRADVDLINQYTPLYQMRREGNANEIASIMQKRGMEQKLPWLLGWITKMDVMTVGRLWSAAEYMVADQQKNLPVGSDEYYKAVAKVFNDTVQQTQPNFTPLQRNAALRSKNPIVRSLVLFGTQRMQNGGIMIEAALELKNSKGKSKAEIKAARAKLGRAVASQIVQNILLIVASAGVDVLRGRMKGWQDKDKEITVESVSKYLGDSFLSNFVGSFLGGSEVYDLVSAWYKKTTDETVYDTEFTVPALEASEFILNYLRKELPDTIKYLTSNGHTAEEKLKKAETSGSKLVRAFGYATGIPFENAYKDLFNGIIPAIQDLQDWKKTGELNPWLHQSGKLDSKKTAANYKEWTKLGYKGSTYFYWENKMKDVSGGREGRIPLLRESDLTNEQKAKLMELFDTSGATSKGTVVYNKKGEVIVDFAD